MEHQPNCYECRHRRTIPGDAHSRCSHPEVKKTSISDCFMSGLAEAYLGKAELARIALDVRGGGQTWPANFNPAFLTSCRGFEPKEEPCPR